MNTSRLLLLVIASLAAFWLYRGTLFQDDNIRERKKYWTGEISSSIPTGTSVADLEAFAKGHGQTLECKRNYERKDQCTIYDNQSAGGTAKAPMKLAAIFDINDGRVSGYQLTAVSVPN